MTLRMADDIYVSTLPAGYDAYLGYVDGMWPTYHALVQAFPGKFIIGLTVTGATLNADGCDIETGDLSAVSGAQWLKNKLATKPKLPPVAYCSVDSMAAVVSELAALGVPRGSVLLLSAHYGIGEHICGPAQPGVAGCGFIDFPQDGTQWTDAAAGNGGAQIDASLLTDSFFGPAPTNQENDMPLLIGGGPNGAISLLDGGKMHHVTDTIQPYVAAGIPLVTVSAGEYAALLADYPPGNPAVTVPPLTLPAFTIAGTATPA